MKCTIISWAGSNYQQIPSLSVWLDSAQQQTYSPLCTLCMLWLDFFDEDREWFEASGVLSPAWAFSIAGLDATTILDPDPIMLQILKMLSQVLTYFRFYLPILLNKNISLIHIWTVSSQFGTYRLYEQRRFRRACASEQSRQNLRCSLIQAVSQEEP